MASEDDARASEDARDARDVAQEGKASKQKTSLPGKKAFRLLDDIHPFKKIQIAFAGPLANFLLAIFVLFAGWAWQGVPVAPPVIEQVMPGSLAEKAGFQAKDRIVAVNDADMKDFRHLTPLLSRIKTTTSEAKNAKSEEIIFSIKRADALHTLRVPTEALYQEKKLGLVPVKMHVKRVGIVQAFCDAVTRTWRMTVQIFHALTEVALLKQAGGMLLIAKVSKDVTHAGWPQLLEFVSLLSLNLGLFNLLPIPALDGGQIVFCGVSWVLGRRRSEYLAKWFYYVGFACILTLFLLTTWNDVQRFNLLASLKSWFS